ncbi:D-alanyl-D-alanine carboxypeptidase/D-alanyl-D-alanine endopeptidase [Thetidibacter halocola]|uniref:D-alanyl-D-alanine carboxypeptidase/D-alanyl-D-alanine endopeptidase n=1 Tax=Thetidibacter halocola TaxID=2827239 RepID=UPI003D160CF0
MDRRRFLTGLGAALWASPAIARAPETSIRPVARGEDLRLRSQPDPAALIERAQLGDRVSFALMDLNSGEMLETHAADLAQPPASVAKALTAAYALESLGPDFRFETRLLATGPITEGTLEGDLILAGGGDPTLDTDGLADLADQLRAAGITKVAGAFKVAGGALPDLPLIDPDQPDHVGYNPAVAGLNLNYNRVHFGWKRNGSGYEVTMDARSERYRPDVRMARMKVEPRAVPIYTYADREGRDDWTVARDALGDGGARWLPVRKPALYAGEVFQTLAKAQGISLPPPQVMPAPPATGETVARLESGPLRVILRDMLHWSTNLTAEIVGMTATLQRSGAAPASLRDSARAMNAWAAARFGLTTMDFVDHSGLGDASRISAPDMVRALREVRRSRGLKPLLKPVPMKDERGRPIGQHPLVVHAKTGTLNFVSGLAGFIDVSEGRELVFAIFAADLNRRATLTEDQRERPEGGRSWNARAKSLQQALIERWGVVYAA